MLITEEVEFLLGIDKRERCLSPFYSVTANFHQPDGQMGFTVGWRMVLFPEEVCHSLTTSQAKYLRITGERGEADSQPQRTRLSTDSYFSLGVTIINQPTNSYSMLCPLLAAPEVLAWSDRLVFIGTSQGSDVAMYSVFLTIRFIAGGGALYLTDVGSSVSVLVLYLVAPATASPVSLITTVPLHPSKVLRLHSHPRRS